MIILRVDAARFADWVHLDHLEERVGDAAHRLPAATLLPPDVWGILHTGDPIPEEQ